MARKENEPAKAQAPDEELAWFYHQNGKTEHGNGSPTLPVFLVSCSMSNPN
jgi:hypothetical protein